MMTIEQAKEKFYQLQAELQALTNAKNLFLHDSATAAPIGSAAARGRTLGALEALRHRLYESEDTEQSLAQLRASDAQLSKREERMLQLFTRQMDRMKAIPAKDYADYQAVTAEAYSVWGTAKANNDFAMLSPYLERIFSLQREFSVCTMPGKDPYDACLEQYEPGLTGKTCDALFARMRETVVPLIAAINEKTPPRALTSEGAYPKGKQVELSHRLMDIMRVDRSHCVLAETEHPGTTSFTKSDLRVTTRYKTDDFAFSMAMVMHESGHALYEMHTQDEDAFTLLGTFASMSLHESQSRFYENLIGKSRDFIEFITLELKNLFPTALGSFTAGGIYRAVNRVSPNPIRMEADELSYAVHIMIRYELEKAVINDQLKVRELPTAWNDLYRKYLGITVKNDREGILQDCHWAYGSIGYFPTYALGNAYGAQMLRTMKRSLNVEELVRRGVLQPINDWLENAVWKLGARYDTAEVIQRACGEPFDASAYTDYLTSKFTELYQL